MENTETKPEPLSDFDIVHNALVRGAAAATALKSHNKGPKVVGFDPVRAERAMAQSLSEIVAAIHRQQTLPKPS